MDIIKLTEKKNTGFVEIYVVKDKIVFFERKGNETLITLSNQTHIIVKENCEELFELLSDKKSFNFIQRLIKLTSPDLVGNYSDGYHSFNELYDFRKVYNAALFNEWSRSGLYDVHKSIKHNDNELCFGGGWFIVVAVLPTGQISNHYPIKDWDLFNIPEFDKAKYPFDGHTPNDVLLRLKSLT